MRRNLISLFFLLAVFLTACREQTNTPSPSDIPRYAVIPKCVSYEFWKEVRLGALAATNELEVDLTWTGTLKEDDIEGQIALLNEVVAQGVDGIVLAPLDAETLVEPVNAAIEAGIPVVIIDSALNNDNPISFVATDNEEGGRIAGQYLAELLEDTGDVTLLRFQEGSASTDSREEGFLDSIAKHPGISAIETEWYGGVTPESAYAQGEALIRSLSNEDGSLQVDGIFCPNESTTIGMLRALEDAGLTSQVHLVGFDSSELLLEALDSERIDALVIQDPHAMGYLGVKALHSYLQGEDVEKRIDTGARLIKSSQD